jgi:hypothetical protein
VLFKFSYYCGLGADNQIFFESVYLITLPIITLVFPAPATPSIKIKFSNIGSLVVNYLLRYLNPSLIMFLPIILAIATLEAYSYIVNGTIFLDVSSFNYCYTK